MNEVENDFKLYIPSNVKTRLEFFNLIPVVIEFIGVSITVICTTKDENNLCVIDQIKYMLEFVKMQKKYVYRYFDKWR